MSTVTLRIPDSLRKDLRKLSRTQKRPVSDLARDALRRYVAVEEFRALRRKTLPFAEARGILTDEDVFRAVS